jgi:hypothetical protein
MRLAAHQPQYLPWLGYFDKLDRVDRFVLLDVVQYKKNEWQNRNRIRTRDGWQWLTVPVHYRFPMSIREVTLDDEGGRWRRKHREALRTHYARSPHRAAILPELEALLDETHPSLAHLNARTVRLLADRLGVRTPISLASEVPGLPEGPDERLIGLCRQFGCVEYLAGAGGAAYMDLDAWRRAGIAVEFQDFRHPVYPQAYPGFEAHLSALDLLCNCGPGSIARIRATREAA